MTSNKGRMMAESNPILVGVEGFVVGEEFQLEHGKSLIVGRSRSCDVSLRHCAKWLQLDPDERDLEQDFKTVSRKHMRVTYYNVNSIEIEDLSSNGTFVDGKRIDRILISDIKEKQHEILLGTQERFRLEWKEA